MPPQIRLVFRNKFLLMNFVGLMFLVLMLLTAHNHIITSIQIQTIDGKITYLSQKSGRNRNQAQDYLEGQDGNSPIRGLKDTEVIFEPEAECIQKRLETKKAIKAAMKNYTCSIFSGRNQNECELIEQEANEFFEDEKVLERLADPKTYFQKISTVAFRTPTAAETKLPFAYSILNHANIGLLESLLSVIFRPHNSYCIYIDAKSSDTYKMNVAKLLSVYRYHFPDTTIINANPTLRIYWSGVSILEAGLDCMEQLLNANSEWKYFFNSIGTALPGMPVQEIAERLTHIEGDVVASVPMTDFIKGYQTHKYLLPKDADNVNFSDFERGKQDVFLYHEEHLPYKTTIRKMRPPRGIVPYYNMTESAISRTTANFLLYNQVAKEFRAWVQDIKAPEEFFYATMARIDQKSAENPGRFSVLQDFDKDTTQGICPRHSNWDGPTCKGVMKRWICNFSLEDLPSALSTHCLWINKFDLKVDALVVHCLREYLVK